MCFRFMSPLYACLALLAGDWILFDREASAQDSQVARKPNVLVVLTDDQGWATLGCYGGKIVPTPHLDRLAAEGARFTDAYVTSQCTPTRATLLTGQYTARHGLWHVLPWYGYPLARMTEPPFAEDFPRSTYTIAKGLRDVGYATAIMGKWHLTSNQDGNYRGLRPSAAKHYGFDFAPPLLSDEEFAEGADRGVETLTDQAIEFIKRRRGQPWFCFLSHHMIHGKVVAPEKIVRKYRNRGYGDEGPNRAVYLAGLECIDRSVGRLMTSLDESGESDHTLVLFLSDNGGIDQRLDFKQVPVPAPPNPTFDTDIREYDNDPLRSGKGSIYEGGIRVPLIARWPGRINPQSVIDTPVHAVDILPTCLEIAGARRPQGHPLDGESLLGLFTESGSDRLSRRPLYQFYPFYDLRWGLTPSACIRFGNYKLIEFFGDRVDDDHQYVVGSRVELYDLNGDIGETSNLVHADPGRAKAMRAQLHRWLEEMNAEIPTNNPHFQAADAFHETRSKPAWLVDRVWSRGNSIEPTPR